MSSIPQLIEEHHISSKKWEKKKQKLDEARKKIRQEEIKFKNDFESKMTSLDKKMDSHWDKHPHHIDTILKPIAEKIAKTINLSHKISGSFGMNHHYYLSFLDKKGKTVYILYLRPNREDRWYGVVTNKIIDKTISPNSIAGMNDDHKEVIPLPKTIPKIIKMMKSEQENGN